MRGFKVFFKGEVMNIAPRGDAGFMIHDRNGHSNITASGLSEDSNDYYTWIDSTMKVGDEVEIEIADLNESTDPIFTKSADSNLKFLSEKEIEEMRAERLDYFYALEQALIKEGLLTK